MHSAYENVNLRRVLRAAHPTVDTLYKRRVLARVTDASMRTEREHTYAKELHLVDEAVAAGLMAAEKTVKYGFCERERERGRDVRSEDTKIKGGNGKRRLTHLTSQTSFSAAARTSFSACP